MVRRSAVLMCVGFGCAFRILPSETIDAPPSDGDGAMDGGANDLDAPVDVPTDAPGPFMNPTPIVALNSTASEDDPTLTGDTLEICFDRDGDIVCATRSSTASAWSAVQPVNAINTAASETTPEFSADGLALYFSSSRAGGAGATDVYLTTRATRSTAWTAPTRIVALASASDDLTPTLAPDGLALYLSTNRAGTMDVFRSTRATPSDPLGAPTLVAELSSAAFEGDAITDAAHMTVYISSDRAGGTGGLDLWFATKTSGTSLTWGPPSPAVELNTTSIEQDPWLSPDGHTLVFASDRSGNSELYISTR